MPCHGRRRIDFQIRLHLDPFMIHEAFPTVTETAFGSHPCRVVSVTYRKRRPFHGGNTGSNPVGDANNLKSLTRSRILIEIHDHDEVTIEHRASVRFSLNAQSTSKPKARRTGAVNTGTTRIYLPRVRPA
jgi:hypothetical protein